MTVVRMDFSHANYIGEYMKGLFPQYDDLPSRDYGVVWNNALFIFDTNVLLNLYRYRAETSKELLNVLSQLSDRIWIPHHVALEFQRNRLKVIAEQNKRFDEVRRTMEKAQNSLVSELGKLQLQKRHSLINPQALISGFEKLADEFLKELDRLQETQQKLSAPDPLKGDIEALFDGRVGTPPRDQSVVDELYKQAEVRFKAKIPPGYRDSEKDKDVPDEYIHGGIIYKRKYGDFLVWKQLLEHSKSVNAASIIFVTDDGKEDWWLKIESDGPKTIGPRPELIEEARSSALVETLLMYSPEAFLKYAMEFLKSQVSEETLEEVRDISIFRSARHTSFREERMIIEHDILQRLKKHFKTVQVNRRGFPDFVAEREGKTFGFDVKVVRNMHMFISRVRASIYEAYHAIKERGFCEMTIVWVVNSPSEADKSKQILALITRRDEIPDNLRIVIGAFEDPEFGGSGFLLYDELA